MKLPVPYLMTSCCAVGCSRSTVLHSVCCLLHVLVRRMTYSLCVVCCTGLCSHSAALQHLQHLQSAAQPSARWYRYKLCVISPYNYKCSPPHCNILRVFCEVGHTHAQTDDAPCQLNRRFAHGTVLKWRQVFWVCLWESRKTKMKEFWK
jgi:hypothetical protein